MRCFCRRRCWATTGDHGPWLGQLDKGAAMSETPTALFEPVFDHAAATVARDVALATVEEKAGAPFMAAAKAFVLAYLEQHGPTSGEIVTDACRAAGIRPAKADDRAFGAVYMGLARAGLIVKHGYCERRKGHRCAGGIIWRHAAAGV